MKKVVKDETFTWLLQNGYVEIVGEKWWISKKGRDVLDNYITTLTQEQYQWVLRTRLGKKNADLKTIAEALESEIEDA